MENDRKAERVLPKKPGKILERQKAYNAAHKEEKAAYDKARYKKNWKKKAEYNWKYYQRRKAAAKCQNVPVG